MRYKSPRNDAFLIKTHSLTTNNPKATSSQKNIENAATAEVGRRLSSSTITGGLELRSPKSAGIPTCGKSRNASRSTAGRATAASRPELRARFSHGYLQLLDVGRGSEESNLLYARTRPSSEGILGGRQRSTRNRRHRYVCSYGKNHWAVGESTFSYAIV